MSEKSKRVDKHQLAVIIVVVLAAIIGAFIVLNQSRNNLAGEAFRGGNPQITCQDFGKFVEDVAGRRYYDNSCDGNYLITDYHCKGGTVQVNSRIFCQHVCLSGACVAGSRGDGNRSRSS